MNWLYKSRYTRYLETEVERLKLELDKSTLERQAAVNSLLQHIGAPTMQLTPVERKTFSTQRTRNVPSVYRRMQELLSRKAEATQ